MFKVLGHQQNTIKVFLCNWKHYSGITKLCFVCVYVYMYVNMIGVVLIYFQNEPLVGEYEDDYLEELEQR
jgi:hypothetical protein